jgi:polyphosphate kinase 2
MGKKEKKISNEEYEKQLNKLHAELVKLQYWVRKKGLRIIVVFEGRDAAGKGGIIKRITERVSPRIFRVVALPTPSEKEKTQMYAQRYIQHFPAAGEIVIFDRSWYNRAGVERVMGFCTREEYIRFLQYTPVFERMIIDSGIKLIKYWLDISMEEQERRFQKRITDPRKIWKLSPMDVESYQRWYDYSRARDDMFIATDTDYAPWYIVPADDKKRARLNCIAHFLSLIPYEDVTPDKIELGKRDTQDHYDDRISPELRHFIPEKY